MKDTKNGFKLINNIARFTTPLIIVETPAEYPEVETEQDVKNLPSGQTIEQLKLYEQMYLDVTAEILKMNSGTDWIPIVVRLENSDDPRESEQRVTLHTEFIKALDTEMKQSYSPSQIVSEQVIIGHSRRLWATGDVYVNPGDFKRYGKMTEYCFPERVIGCSIADAEIVRMYRETIEELKDKTLTQGTGVDNQGKAVGGDYYFDPKTDRVHMSDTGYAKTWGAIQKKIKQTKIAETFNFGRNNNRIEWAEVKTEAAPLYAAVMVIQFKHPELRKKRITEIVASQEIENIVFPPGPFANDAAEFVKKITGKKPSFKSK